MLLWLGCWRCLLLAGSLVRWLMLWRYRLAARSQAGGLARLAGDGAVFTLAEPSRLSLWSLRKLSKPLGRSCLNEQSVREHFATK